MQVKYIGKDGATEKYVVYAMLMRKGVLSYFLTDHPAWYPADQFEVISELLSLNWYFYHNKENETAIWGYKELVFDEGHYEALVEREPEAVEIFERRKEEIDEYEELSKVK